MILILGITNLCPRSCEYFSAEAGDEELLECPLGRWDQRVARGVVPTGE